MKRGHQRGRTGQQAACQRAANGAAAARLQHGAHQKREARGNRGIKHTPLGLADSIDAFIEKRLLDFLCFAVSHHQNRDLPGLNGFAADGRPSIGEQANDFLGDKWRPIGIRCV